MTLGDTSLTRTSANTLTGERTEVTSGRGRALVGAALARGAPDNVSVVVVGLMDAG